MSQHLYIQRICKWHLGSTWGGGMVVEAKEDSTRLKTLTSGAKYSVLKYTEASTVIQLFHGCLVNSQNYSPEVPSTARCRPIFLICIVQTLTADHCHSEALLPVISVNSDDSVPSTACTVLFSWFSKAGYQAMVSYRSISKTIHRSIVRWHAQWKTIHEIAKNTSLLFI